mmetsp:Transcript_47358/g.107535  ORF Transcript_47358/g.107535 Transcript_47358/m.107535 type:complete len:206 (+) Transcript_47358:1658-2275(+)
MASPTDPPTVRYTSHAACGRITIPARRRAKRLRVVLSISSTCKAAAMRRATDGQRSETRALRDLTGSASLCSLAPAWCAVVRASWCEAADRLVLPPPLCSAGNRTWPRPFCLRAWMRECTSASVAAKVFIGRLFEGRSTSSQPFASSERSPVSLSIWWWYSWSAGRCVIVTQEIPSSRATSKSQRSMSFDMEEVHSSRMAKRGRW